MFLIRKYFLQVIGGRPRQHFTLTLNLEPWHGQSQLSSALFHRTSQAACGQVLLKDAVFRHFLYREHMIQIHTG